MPIRLEEAELLIPHHFPSPSPRTRPFCHRFSWMGHYAIRLSHFSGGTTVERFKRYLETDLLPHLNGNSVFIMDNMKSHHAKAVRNLLDSSGVRCIYLPPYSPDLNPIEKLWSTVKSFLRKFKARTLDALPNAIQCAFQTVSPSDCSGWFHSCGYSPYF